MKLSIEVISCVATASATQSPVLRMDIVKDVMRMIYPQMFVTDSLEGLPRVELSKDLIL